MAYQVNLGIGAAENTVQTFILDGFGVASGGGGGESLAAGDLTTAFVKWMATKNLGDDANTAIRDALATHYSTDGGEDLTTLLARFLRDRS